MPSLSRARSAALAGAAFALALASSGGGALAAGPFGDVVGNWIGGGTVTLGNGSQERIRCQAAYAPGSSDDNLRSTIRCASDSYKFELQSDLNHRSGAISGAWKEANRNITGLLSGTAKPGEIKARIEMPGFGADIDVQTKGNKQTVVLNSQSTELTGISIALTKR